MAASIAFVPLPPPGPLPGPDQIPNDRAPVDYLSYFYLLKQCRLEEAAKRKQDVDFERLKKAVPPRPGTAAGVRPKIGILGAGAAGLYAAMLLESLKDELPYDIEILEASPDRIGGRLYTHRFSAKDENGKEIRKDNKPVYRKNDYFVRQSYYLSGSSDAHPATGRGRYALPGHAHDEASLSLV
jgi:hypothetical protein